MLFRIAAFIGLSAAIPLSAWQQPAPPGRLIDIGGRKLHLNCTGAGTPTVILVAGGGAFSIDWSLVQPKVAASTRVCSYDRAGLAWSDPAPPTKLWNRPWPISTRCCAPPVKKDRTCSWAHR